MYYSTILFPLKKRKGVASLKKLIVKSSAAEIFNRKTLISRQFLLQYFGKHFAYKRLHTITLQSLPLKGEN
jgi:hypothetical protein